MTGALMGLFNFLKNVLFYAIFLICLPFLLCEARIFNLFTGTRYGLDTLCKTLS